MTPGGADRLVDPQGNKLIEEPRVIIIQVEKDMQVPGQLAQALGQVTNSSVFVMPFTWNITRGDMAENVLRDLHDHIHKALGLGEA